jgi:hypothetical protein
MEVRWREFDVFWEVGISLAIEVPAILSPRAFRHGSKAMPAASSDLLRAFVRRTRTRGFGFQSRAEAASESPECEMAHTFSVIDYNSGQLPDSRRSAPEAVDPIGRGQLPLTLQV